MGAFFFSTMAQFGTGSQLLGGTDALSQAMASRGIDTSILNQQTPASMGGAQSIPTPTQQGSASPVVSNVSANNPSMAAGAGVPSSEAELILKALTNRLSVLSKNGM